MMRTLHAMICAAALLASCASLPPGPPPAPAASPEPDTLAWLTAGEGVACITTTSGAGYCWGDIGQDRGTPVRVLDADGSPARVRAVVPAWRGTCAVTMDDEVLCNPEATGGWTDSAGARLPVPPGCGYGACILPLPVRGAVPDRAVRAVAVGWSHGCALGYDGGAYCWGSNSHGELARGTRSADSTGSGGPYHRGPALIAGGVRFSQISARRSLTCGVAVHNGGVYCWGYGQDGQTGDSAAQRGCPGARPREPRDCDTAVPRRVLPDSVPGRYDDPSRIRFRQVSAGGALACAVDTSGRVFCWGDNYRCGLGRCRHAKSPWGQYVSVPGHAVEVHVGGRHACARTADARVFCWGDNNHGQLGSLVTANAGPDGGPPDYRDTADASVRSAAYAEDACFLGGRCSPAAVQVAPERRWRALAVGTDYGCGLGDDGAVYCWGASVPALGTSPRTVPCENRSATWKDVPCQPSPAPVAGLPRLAPPPVPRTPAPGRRAAADSTGIRGTRVLASRRELRVVFPRDTARAWGWSELEDRDYRAGYGWSISIEGMDGPRTLGVSVARGPGEGARRFGSLRELVAGGSASICIPDMFANCSPRNVAASVEDGAVVVTLRDSAVIARLVGLRPEWATVWHVRPEVPPSYRSDSVRVEYVDPQLSIPDSALRAEGAAARRRYEAAVNTISRRVTAPGMRSGEMWMAVGDSVRLRVDESTCSSDVCGGGYQPLTASGWRVADSTVVRLLAPADTGRAWERYRVAASVVARRAGRTRVQVLGLAGPSDTLPSSRPVPRELEVTVVVTPAAARVELSPRIQVARVGDEVRFHVRALDARGREIDGAPVGLLIARTGYSYAFVAPDLYPFRFDVPDRYTVTASYGGRTDTLVVDVLPAAAPPVP